MPALLLRGPVQRAQLGRLNDEGMDGMAYSGVVRLASCTAGLKAEGWSSLLAKADSTSAKEA